MAIPLETAERLIRERAEQRIRSSPPVLDLGAGDMVCPVITITPQQIATAAECDGLLDVFVQLIRVEQLTSYPLSHSDSIQLGMGYLYEAHYLVTISPNGTSHEVV
jgi:3,4-dihydroxy-2-butanone 4-phosphate synthase